VSCVSVCVQVTRSEGGTLGYTCVDNGVRVCVQVTRRGRGRGGAEKESESESDRVGRFASGALALTHTRLRQR
jgi:hypothetical protein